METHNKMDDKFLPLSVIAAGALIAGAVYWNGQNPQPIPTPTGSGLGGAPSAPQVNIKNVSLDGRPFIGRANAPVIVAAWGDYRCSFCRKFEFETLPQIVKEYVETGKVKVVFLDFAFLGPGSNTIALYGHSVWKLYPSAYHAWRTAVYTAQGAGDPDFGEASSVDKINATVAGIDAARVAADVKANEGAYQALVDADRAEGQKFGIGATPSFIIGTQVIQGALPYANFKTAIDAALR